MESTRIYEILRTMSQENVEIVRRIFDAYGRGEEAPELFGSDVIWNPAEEAASQGHDALRASLERWEADFEDYETTPEDFIDAGDKVLVTVHFSGKGKGSGINVDVVLYEVWALNDGKVVRMDEYTERPAAFEAAGLSE